MRRLHYLVLVIPLIAGDGAVHADSVAQVQTAKRISEQTVQLIDPQGGTSTGGAGSNVNYAVGDVLTFQIRFTPVENNATRGFGGYITEYVPPNTEVVGARIVDDSGNTVCPHRGGFGALGWGPRGANNYNPADFPTFPAQGYLQGEGGMSALYADTGVFFSTDSRTTRVPEDDFTTVFEGLVMSCTPTGAGQLDDLLGANLGGPYFAHNDWDNIQLVGYGCSSSTIGDGTGNTPFGYGSAVAGPDTFYSFEATETMPGVVAAVGAIGPWQRVKTPCAEIGTGVPALERGPIATRVGVPTSAGWVLSGDNPLPAGTNAVRFAVGELVVGDEYLAEISLRVLAAPLDPNFCNDPPGCVDLGADVNCSEVFGGDASGRAKDGSDGGKDNTWRYFLPGPACVKLDLQFDLDVDKIQALSGDTLVYSLTARNLDSVNTHDMVDISLDLLAGVGTVNFVSATNGGTVNAGVVTWPTTTLAPGDFVEHEVTVVATGNNSPILARATYSSDQLAGFSVVSLTNLTPLALLDLEMLASPASSTAGGTVTYTAFITNNGTGAANFGCASCGITIKLPAGFTVVPGTVQVDGTGVGNPVGPPPQYVFSSGLPVLAANGGFTQLVFDVLIDGATAPGVYRSDLETYMRDPGAGREIDDAVAQIAPVLVDVVQSDVPTVVTPISSGSTMVCGTSTEPNGATIRVYVDLLEVGTTTVGGGAWCATVPTLFAGQNVTATAQDTGNSEVESDMSPQANVVGAGSIGACNDTIDNDNDGLIDFPDDPGCTSAIDPDETDVTQCSDGIDNDMDGDIDFPDDTSCSNYADNDESGPPACGDGIDNDLDGATDFPDDPGCDDANDVDENDFPQCANGIDDDLDGMIDYPIDPGCESANDNDELDPVGGDAGPTADAGVTDDASVVMGADAGVPPDPGGVDAPDTSGGCCSANGRDEAASGLLVLLFAFALRRRRAVSLRRD